jgi:hypothetical protein
MNYIDILLIGYYDPATKDFFKDYLNREFKKSNYSPDEFFNGCLKATETMAEGLWNTYFRIIEANPYFDKLEPFGFSGSLLHLTNGRFVGHLAYEEIKLIERDIKEVWSKHQKVKPALHHFFRNLTDIEGFLFELKESFPTEKGLSIRAIIDIGKAKNIIFIPERGYKTFISELGNYFNRDIGKVQGIQNPDNAPKEVMASIAIKLEPLIKKYYSTIE